jgi:hypothetical protein
MCPDQREGCKSEFKDGAQRDRLDGQSVTAVVRSASLLQRGARLMERVCTTMKVARYGSIPTGRNGCTMELV